MNRSMGITLLLGTMLLSAGVLYAGDDPSPLKSGLKVGESTPAFDVINVAGPFKGQTLCVR